jgi:DNA-binding beta-propeller fold protein YncE
VTPDGKTLYVAEYSDDTVIPVNLATGRPGTPIIIENHVLALESALAITPDGRTLYALNGNYGESIVPDTSTVTPVSTADGRLGGAIRTGGLFGHASAFGFAVAPDGRTAYVAQSDVVAIALPRLPALAVLRPGNTPPTPAPRTHSSR